MFFARTDEQRALDETVRDVLADRPDLVRTVFEDVAGDGHPPELWRAAAEGGWLAATVPEEHDGLGLGLLDATVVAQRLGTGCAPGPWAASVLATEAVRLAGDDAQRADLLPRLASGTSVGTVVLRRAGGAWDATGVGVVAAADGTLTGTAAAVPYAHVADVLVVAATTPAGEVALHVADRDAVEVQRLDTLDRTTRLCDVSFASVPATRLAHASADVFLQVLARGAVLTAADLAGVAREALRRTVAYDTEREQFGRPVGSFQAVKHALADLHVGVTMAEHAVAYAAHALDTDRPDAALMVAVAKAKASDVARDATAAMIQYHGGIGYTWEHDAHFFFKRAKREEYEFGDARWHRETIAALVVDGPGQPWAA